ncbi:thrombospondin type 3 repeat-containing protein [Candidatus Peregrinibacteria bacterium]|nr:thrombospondin type 3 repeat-containing protein [Candidatus Peregrinibacteria bacterium]
MYNPGQEDSDGDKVGDACQNGKKVTVGEVCTLFAKVQYPGKTVGGNSIPGVIRDVSRLVYWEGFFEVGVFVNGNEKGQTPGGSDLFIIPRSLATDTPTFANITALLVLSGEDPADPEAVTERSSNQIRLEVSDPGKLESLEISSECDEYRAPPESAGADDDRDGILNGVDNCPYVSNPRVDGKQPDTDNDGIGDACDKKPKILGDICTLKAEGTFDDGTKHTISHLVEWLGYQNIGKMVNDAKPGDSGNGLLEIEKRGRATITAVMPFSIFDKNPGIPGDDISSIEDILYKERGDGVSSPENDPIIITAANPGKLVLISVSSPNCGRVQNGSVEKNLVGQTCVLIAKGTFEDGSEYDITPQADVTWIGFESVGDEVNETGILNLTKSGMASIRATRRVYLEDSEPEGGPAPGIISSSNNISVTVLDPQKLESIAVSSEGCDGKQKLIHDICVLRAMGTFQDLDPNTPGNTNIHDISHEVTWNGFSAVGTEIKPVAELEITKTGIATITASRLLDPDDDSKGLISSDPAKPIVITGVDPGEALKITVDSDCNNKDPVQNPIQKHIGEYCELRATATYQGRGQGCDTNPESCKFLADVSSQVLWRGYEGIGVIDASNKSLLEITKRNSAPETIANITAIFEQSLTHETYHDIVSENPPIKISIVEKKPEIRGIHTVGNFGIGRNTHEKLFVDIFTEPGDATFDTIQAHLYEGSFASPADITGDAFPIIIEETAPLITAGQNAVMIELPILIPDFAGMDEGPFTFLVKITTNSGNVISAVHPTYLGTAPTGDFNGNKYVELSDIISMMRIVNGEISLANEEQRKRIDMNFDRVISLLDVLLAYRRFTSL